MKRIKSTDQEDLHLVERFVNDPQKNFDEFKERIRESIYEIIEKNCKKISDKYMIKECFKEELLDLFINRILEKKYINNYLNPIGIATEENNEENDKYLLGKSAEDIPANAKKKTCSKRPSLNSWLRLQSEFYIHAKIIVNGIENMDGEVITSFTTGKDSCVGCLIKLAHQYNIQRENEVQDVINTFRSDLCIDEKLRQSFRKFRCECNIHKYMKDEHILENYFAEHYTPDNETFHPNDNTLNTIQQIEYEADIPYAEFINLAFEKMAEDKTGEKYVEVLSRVNLYGEDYENISKITGTEVNTLRQHHSRGIKRALKIFKEAKISIDDINDADINIDILID